MFYTQEWDYEKNEPVTDRIPYTGEIAVDGYQFGDTLLDGVWFIADVVDGVMDDTSIRVAKDCAQYFENLNKEKWLKAAVQECHETDVLHIPGTDGEQEVYCDEWEQKKRPEPMMIGITSIGSILGDE